VFFLEVEPRHIDLDVKGGRLVVVDSMKKVFAKIKDPSKKHAMFTSLRASILSLGDANNTLDAGDGWFLKVYQYHDKLYRNKHFSPDAYEASHRSDSSSVVSGSSWWGGKKGTSQSLPKDEYADSSDEDEDST